MTIPQLFLAALLTFQRGFYCARLDAVRHTGPATENRWPEATFYLLNIYETIDPKWHCGDIDDDEVLPGALLEEHNVTVELDAGIDHEALDDHVQVKALVRDGLEFLMLR